MLRRVAPNVNSEQVKLFVPVFNEWSDAFGINTPMRAALFLANVMHESSCLNRLEENLNYSAEGLMRTWPSRFPTREKAEKYARKPQAIANYVYANRMGNGSESSGDGWKYRGRGAIQITGFQTYAMYEKSGFCNGNLTSHPEWLAKSPGAWKSAMWYWKANGLNSIADRGDSEAVCRRINGGLNGLADRNYYFRKFKREFAI